MYDLPTDYLQTYRDRVRAVTRADVQRVAQLYVQPDHTAIVIVGDAAELRAQVADYAPAEAVEVYDNHGQRK